MQITKIELVTGGKIVNLDHLETGPDEVATFWVRLRFANGKIAMNTEVYNTKAHARKVFALFQAAFPKAKAVHVDNEYKD